MALEPDNGRITEDRIRAMCADVCKELILAELGDPMEREQILLFIREEMRARAWRRELWRKFQVSVVGQIALILIGGTVYIVGQTIVEWVRNVTGSR